jgi:hypothetical protein
MLQVVDHRELALGLQAFDDLRVVLLGLREAGDHVDLADAGGLELGGERLRMVDDGVRAQRQAPLARFCARSGRDDSQPGELARELDQDGAHAARAAGDEQRLPFAAVLGHLQAVEQQFVGGDGGQRQRGGLGVVEALRRDGGNALVHSVQLGVGAGANDGAGVVHAVAHLEVLHAGANGLDRAHGVPAQHLGLAGLGRGVLADLGVHRVDRHRLHAHQQVARAGHGGGQLDVLQRFRVVDGKGLVVADGFHDGVLSVTTGSNVGSQGRFDKAR